MPKHIAVLNNAGETVHVKRKLLKRAVFASIDTLGSEVGFCELRKSCERLMGLAAGALEPIGSGKIVEYKIKWAQRSPIPSSSSSFPSSAATLPTVPAQPKKRKRSSRELGDDDDDDGNDRANGGAHSNNNNHNKNNSTDGSSGAKPSTKKLNGSCSLSTTTTPVLPAAALPRAAVAPHGKIKKFKAAKKDDAATVVATAAAVDESRAKKGKFSQDEDDTITTHVTHYLDQHGLQVADIAIGLRDDKPGGRKGEHRELWDELLALLPGRLDRKAIRTRTRRLLMQHTLRSWTDEEKEQLQGLVELHGRKWSIIGRTLNRINDDCKNTYERMTAARMHTGRFSQKEDAQLLACIKTLCGSQSVVRLQAFKPSWTALASTLENKRSYLDYLRHWPTVLAGYVLAGANEANENDDDNYDDGGEGVVEGDGKGEVAAKRNLLQLPEKAELYRNIIGLVISSGAQHVSAVDWPEIDRKLGLYHGCARKIHNRKFAIAIEAISMPDATFQESFDYLRTHYAEGIPIRDRKCRKKGNKWEDL